MSRIWMYVRGASKRLLLPLISTCVGMLAGSVIGYFLGSAVVGAVLAGAFAFYLTTDASWVTLVDPRTRGIGGGGGTGGGA